MTKLQPGEVVTRTTSAVVRDGIDRNLVATLNGTHLFLRPDGTRNILKFSLCDLYREAAAQQRRERERRQKAGGA